MREPWQQRVIEEHEALGAKLRDLVTFMNGEVFPGLTLAEQSRLRSQRYFMQGYEESLNQRIQAFDGAEL